MYIFRQKAKKYLLKQFIAYFSVLAEISLYITGLELGIFPASVALYIVLALLFHQPCISNSVLELIVRQTLSFD